MAQYLKYHEKQDYQHPLMIVKILIKMSYHEERNEYPKFIRKLLKEDIEYNNQRISLFELYLTFLRLNNKLKIEKTKEIKKTLNEDIKFVYNLIIQNQCSLLSDLYRLKLHYEKLISKFRSVKHYFFHSITKIDEDIINNINKFPIEIICDIIKLSLNTFVETKTIFIDILKEKINHYNKLKENKIEL
jgi:hypothetical protein